MLAFVELLAGGGLLKNIKVYRAEGVTLLQCEAMPAEGHSGLLAAFSDIQWAEGLIDPHAVCGGPCVASHKVLQGMASKRASKQSDAYSRNGLKVAPKRRQTYEVGGGLSLKIKRFTRPRP